MPGYKRKIQSGSIPRIAKDIGEEKKKTISGNPVGNPSNPGRNQVKNRKQQVSHLKTKRKKLNTAYNRNKTDNVWGKYKY